MSSNLKENAESFAEKFKGQTRQLISVWPELNSSDRKLRCEELVKEMNLDLKSVIDKLEMSADPEEIAASMVAHTIDSAVLDILSPNEKYISDIPILNNRCMEIAETMQEVTSNEKYTNLPFDRLTPPDGQYIVLACGSTSCMPGRTKA
jgi:hypothetical protein